MKLQSMGIQIDQLTEEQEHYLASWEQWGHEESQADPLPSSR